MANTRFAYTNLVDASTTTLTNSPSADASYPAANARNGERYIVWRSAVGPASPIDYELDFGSAQAVTLAAGLNLGSTISSIEVESASAPPTWTLRATITPAGAVDKGAVFASQSFRYWRFRVYNSAQFSIGRLWLGVVQSDMEGQMSPGTVKRTIKNRRREMGPSGVQQSFYNGRALHQFDYRFGKITDSVRTLLDNVIQQRTSILLIDDSDVFYETEAADSLDWSVVFTNLQDVERATFQELL